MVPNIKKILFTTNLTESSRNAFFYAAAMATRHGAGLVLLHVMEELSTGVGQQLENLFGREKWHELKETQMHTARDIIVGKRSDYDTIHKALSSMSEMMIPNAADKAFDTHDVIVRSGNVVDEIVAVATETHCDLIVMGAHTDLLGKPKIGSAVKGVMHKLPLPILIAPPPAKATT